MSFADIWDRFFWSAMLAIFVGLVWLKFIDPHIPFAWTGFLMVQVIAWGYFFLGIRKLRNQARRERADLDSREV